MALAIAIPVWAFVALVFLALVAVLDRVLVPSVRWVIRRRLQAAVEKLKARGLTSPYLKPFVVARVNYTRFSKATSFDYDEALDKIIASAAKFNVDRVKQEDVAKAGGGAADEE